jgi:hypothetical protein
MKNNMKLCFLALLVFILLYCCLGTININEGLTNPNENTPPNPDQYHPAERVQQSGAKHAKIIADEYQNDTSGQCPDGIDASTGYCLNQPKKSTTENYQDANDPDFYKTFGKSACDYAGFIWNTSLNKCEKNYPGKDGGGVYKYQTRSACKNAGFTWNSSSNSCDTTQSNNRGNDRLNYCPDGMKWSHKQKKCIRDKQSNNSNSTNDDQSDNSNSANYPTNTVQPNQIIPGDEHLYILKSQIVPPVCPACPPVIQGCGQKTTCAPCPRPLPVPPCPPCERCPDPQFTCKKVPDYRNISSEILPRPLLNDFSKF